MPIILERASIKEDPNMDFEFPDIAINKSSVLLVYEASRELHQNGLMDYIIQFLDSKGATDFEKYVNSSLYFKMPGQRTQAKLRLLNAEFRRHIMLFEQLHNGKMFWVFNYVTLFKKNATHNVVAMTGRGNRSLFNHFAEKLMEFIAHLRG